jgi:hypothetical protein
MTTTPRALPISGFITIGSADDPNPKYDVTAKVERTGVMVFNPKELQVDKNVPWKVNPQANKSPEKGIQLEFSGAEGRSMSIELLFDGYEQNLSVATQVANLDRLASPRVKGSTKEDERRPHLCVVAWGETIENFTCVIEGLSTKYTMFSDKGVPLRATCTVKLKEANVLSMAPDDDKGSTAAAKPAAKPAPKAR